MRRRDADLPPAYAAVELGGTKVVYRVVAAEQRTLAEGRIATTAPAPTLQQLMDELERGLTGYTLAAIGVASFGPLVVNARDERYGRLLATPKPGWSGFDLRAALAARFTAPSVFETDVNAAALAEQACGAGRGVAALAYLTVGTGIGGGLALEGHTLKGALHPEVGHLRLRRRAGDDHASACPFHSDCAEGLASGPALAQRLQGAAPEESPAVLALEAAYLADLLASLVLAWSPQRIVIGGGVMSAAGLLGAVQQALAAALGGYGPAEATAPGYLVRAALADAGLEGALALALRCGRAAPA